jgi:hypothetical protein
MIAVVTAEEFMSRFLWVAVVAALLAPGCVLHHTQSDEDAARFDRVWETPRLKQQVVALKFETELPSRSIKYHDHLLLETVDVLLDSGKFRLAAKGEAPTVQAKITVQVRHDTRWLKTILNGLILYAIPIDSRERVVEVFVVLSTPDGKLIDRQYTQGRGVYEMWLGYVLWPAWIWNDDTEDVTFRDAMKAATVKICRALMPEAEE